LNQAERSRWHWDVNRHWRQWHDAIGKARVRDDYESDTMTEAMTIQRARETVGEDAADMTDAQLAKIIAALDAIADMVLDVRIEKSCKTDGNSRQQEAA
jgi:hypothetical protein